MSQNWEVEPFLWKYACYAGGYHPLRSNSLISRTFIFINLNINRQITQVFASSSIIFTSSTAKYSPHHHQSPTKIQIHIIRQSFKFRSLFRLSWQENNPSEPLVCWPIYLEIFCWKGPGSFKNSRWSKIQFMLPPTPLFWGSMLEYISILILYSWIGSNCCSWVCHREGRLFSIN